MKLIVGLGNPGKEYSTNRHNIGFLCINHIAKLTRIALDNKQCHAKIGKGKIAGNEVILAKPQTYMNASGQSIQPLMYKNSILLEDLIIIHDDLDLPLGKIRIRQGGSSGGHNGIKSTIACLGTQDFIRVRVGIGRPQVEEESRSDNIVDYVLGDFSYEDRTILNETIQRVSDAVTCLINQGVTQAMNNFNKLTGD
jgi:peptidyl-tRNA hydrolase, PTH1 family